jgi:hypothetical protein
MPISKPSANAKVVKVDRPDKKKNVAIFVLVVLIALASGFLLATNWRENDTSRLSYDAIYLNTGDIYFGKLHMFPKPYLTNVLYLQRTTDATGRTQLGLSNFSSAFWGPADVIYLNPSQIEFWAPLRSDSQLIPILENPSLLNQASGAPNVAPSTASGTASSSASGSQK